MDEAIRSLFSVSNIIQAALYLISVLIGAAISIITTYFAEKRKTQLEMERSGAEFVFNISQIYNRIFSLEKHTHKIMAMHESISPDDVWSVFPVSIGATYSQKDLSSSNLYFLSSIKNNEILNEIFSLYSFHNTVVNLYNKYNDLRARIVSDLDPHTQFLHDSIGMVGTSSFNPEAHPDLVRKIGEINQLSKDFLVTLYRGCDRYEKLTTDLSEYLEKNGYKQTIRLERFNWASPGLR